MVGREGKGREKRERGGRGVSREWIRRDGHVENGVYETGWGGEEGQAKEETNAGKEGEVHVLERETRYTLDGDEAPFIRERIEGEEGRWEGGTRGRIWRIRSLGRVARKGERDGGVCVCVEDFPLSSLLPPSSSAFFLEISSSSRPVTRADENYSRNLDDLWTLCSSGCLLEDRASLLTQVVMQV